MKMFDFSRQISSLTKDKKFSEALSFFKEYKGFFENEQIRNNEYIVSDIISCLRQTNNLDAGFRFLSIYGIAIGAEQKERVLCAYGWLLWAKYKAENQNNVNSSNDDDSFEAEEEEYGAEDFDFNKSELLEKIENLIPLVNTFNTDFTKTLSSNLFTIVLKSEKKKPAPNWKMVNEFCNNIQRDALSKECSTVQIERKGEKKEMELASDFENWYAYKTKALTKLGEWQECFDLSKEALEKIPKFHYSNDVWFSRRVALSKRNLGNSDDTIHELQTILRKKREWFIQKELAELYFEKGEVEAALKQATDAINNFGAIEFKVDLLYLLGRILKCQENEERSFQHFSLSKLIRESEEWKIPQKLLEELRTFTFPEIPLTEFKKLKYELQEYWDTFKSSEKKSFGNSRVINENNLEGEVLRILHDNDRGKVGFIKSGGKEYYFSVSPNFRSISKITVGAKVSFEIKQAVDGKREQARIKNVWDS